MDKKIFAFLLVGVLIMTGASCSQNQEYQTTTSTPEDLTLIETDIYTEDGYPGVADFYLNAEILGANTVKFTWSAPEGMDASGGYRILSSSKPEPKIPGAYWDWVAPNIGEITLSDVQSGTRYFRICQWLSTGCGEYSNEVELLVP